MSLLLQDALPNLTDELTALLGELNERDLVEQIPRLRLVGRCECGDDICATLYTAPQPKGAYGPNHQTLTLAPSSGMIILDLVKRDIVCIEILWREDIRSKIVPLFPKSLEARELPEANHHTQ